MTQRLCMEYKDLRTGNHISSILRRFWLMEGVNRVKLSFNPFKKKSKRNLTTFTFHIIIIRTAASESTSNNLTMDNFNLTVIRKTGKPSETWLLTKLTWIKSEQLSKTWGKSKDSKEFQKRRELIIRAILWKYRNNQEIITQW